MKEKLSQVLRRYYFRRYCLVELADGKRTTMGDLMDQVETGKFPDRLVTVFELTQNTSRVSDEDGNQLLLLMRPYECWEVEERDHLLQIACAALGCTDSEVQALVKVADHLDAYGIGIESRVRNQNPKGASFRQFVQAALEAALESVASELTPEEVESLQTIKPSDAPELVGNVKDFGTTDVLDLAAKQAFTRYAFYGQEQDRDRFLALVETGREKDA